MIIKKKPKIKKLKKNNPKKLKKPKNLKNKLKKTEKNMTYIIYLISGTFRNFLDGGIQRIEKKQRNI